MKLILLNIITSLLLATPLFTQKYYVDSNKGNDYNSGLSPNLAWKSLTKINEFNFDYGDTILLKRGCIWREELVVPNDYLTFDTYGIGKLPLIKGSDELVEWSMVSENNWIHYTSSNPGWMWIVDKNDNINWGNKCENKSELKNEFDFYIDSVSVIIHSNSNPHKKYKLIEVSNRNFGIISGWYGNGKNSVKVNNIEICFTKNAAIRTVNSSYWEITNSILHHNGANNESDGQGIQYEGIKGRFVNNIIYENGQHGIFISSFGNAQVEEIVIENNEVFNNYHTAIDLMNDGGYEDSHKNHIIRRNIIYDTPDFKGNEVGIQLLGYDNGMVKNVLIHHNLISNVKGIGISIMDNSDSIYIHNNTILNTTSACLNINNNQGFAEVYNNVGINKEYYSVLFIHKRINKIFDFNIWHTSNPNRTSNVFIENKYHGKIEEYNLITGFDLNGSFGNPQINIVNSKQISLFHNSICIDSGIQLNYDNDLYGKAIQNNIDIGAVEFLAE